MRHFISEACAVAGLAGGMAAPALELPLVLHPGGAQRLPPTDLGAGTSAVDLSPVAGRADHDRHLAARAEEEPEVLDDDPHLAPGTWNPPVTSAILAELAVTASIVAEAPRARTKRGPPRCLSGGPALYPMPGGLSPLPDRQLPEPSAEHGLDLRRSHQAPHFRQPA